MNEIERLQTWMENHRYNQTKLAEEIGMSESGLSHVINGRKRLSPGFKLRFMQRFGVDAANAIFDTPVAAIPETV